MRSKSSQNLNSDNEPLLLNDDHDIVDLENGGVEPSTSNAEPVYTIDEVAKHKTTTDCWVVVHGGVYDVTGFLNRHPGGVAALSKEGRGGTDVTKHFERIGHSTDAVSLLATFKIGTLKPKFGKMDKEWVLNAMANSDQPPDLEGYAVGWHGERRAAILKAHPEVADLQGANHLTIPIGVAISVLHAYICVICQTWSWWAVVLVTWTLGAWCKMGHFAINHDICHGTAGIWAKWEPLKHFWHHVCSLPAIGGEIQHYYAYQHIGHHAALGESPMSAVSLDSFDGDLLSPGVTMLMLAFKGSHIPVDLWSGKGFLSKDKQTKFQTTIRIVMKLLYATLVHGGWFFALLIGQLGMTVTFNPAVMLVMLILMALPVSSFHWLKKYMKGDTSQFDAMISSQALRTATWAAMGVAIHTIFWVVTTWWLVWRANRPEDPTINSVCKGLFYLTFSELFLHGFMCHPYFGYFLGVHRSFGGDFKPKNAAPPPVPVNAHCQPTMSTYSVWTSLSCFNLNLHVEHHDFPRVPWSRLHLVYRAAPEFYAGLEQSSGFMHTIHQWLLRGEEWTYACHEAGGGMLPVSRGAAHGFEMQSDFTVTTPSQANTYG